MTWTAASLLVLGLALAGGFAWYERHRPSAKVIALVATLAALAALGRIAFAPLPNVKPTTDIVLIAGFTLGGAPGFAVGAVAALTSNFFFAQGPWTPWEMAAWGGVGVLGAILARATGRRIGRVPLAVVCAFAGLAYGQVMDTFQWVTFSGDHSGAQLLAYMSSSLPWNLAHALGNLLFALAFGPALIRILMRFRARFEITWRKATPALLALLLLALPVATAAAADSATWLARTQHQDGGFGADPKARSDELNTGWAALGLAAAGRNPATTRRPGGRTALDYVRAKTGRLPQSGHLQTDQIGALERTILVVRAAGGDPHHFAGHDLLTLLRSQFRGDGSVEGLVNHTAFAVLALPKGDLQDTRAASWLQKHQHRDGGFSYAGAGASDIDDTGAVLQALAAAGRGRTTAAHRAAAYITARQNQDGGFPLPPGGPSNAQSTAWAVQGLVAAGRDPARLHRRGARSPLAYLRSLTAADGSVRYDRTGRQTPVWVTSQALLALHRKAFPLAPVARARAAAPATPGALALFAVISFTRRLARTLQKV